MIQSALMITALAATFVYATTDAFDTARTSANNVAAVYETASMINPMTMNYEERQAMNEMLFAKAERLEKLAAYARDVKVEDNNANANDIILGFRNTL